VKYHLFLGDLRLCPWSNIITIILYSIHDRAKYIIYALCIKLQKCIYVPLAREIYPGWYNFGMSDQPGICIRQITGGHVIIIIWHIISRVQANCLHGQM